MNIYIYSLKRHNFSITTFEYITNEKQEENNKYSQTFQYGYYYIIYLKF